MNEIYQHLHALLAKAIGLKMLRRGEPEGELLLPDESSTSTRPRATGEGMGALRCRRTPKDGRAIGWARRRSRRATMEDRHAMSARVYPSQARRATMEAALDALDRARGPVRIVEAGRLRDVHHAESDGHSTLAFAAYVFYRREAGCQLVSIDVDPATELAARGALPPGYAPHVDFVNDNAVTALAEFHGVIDLLYLDAWDVGTPMCAECHEASLRAAEQWLRLGAGIVLVDDTHFPGGGKGALAVPWALTHGWHVTAGGLGCGVQTLLERND